MGVDSKWLARFFARLVGKMQATAGTGGQHSSQGEGATHIGQAAGPVTTVHQVTQHFYAAQPTQPAPQLQPAAQQRFKGNVKPEHKKVLSLMDHLPAPQRKQVLQQMKVDYGTSMVKELWPHEANQLHAMVQSILRSSAPAIRRD